ncbi:hypothetical protein FIU86_19430 [Roseovarius sp. THAF9]|nr:hypothetical protein FIU86_19430 [Roseovarius sp. THAF9]
MCAISVIKGVWQQFAREVWVRKFVVHTMQFIR